MNNNLEYQVFAAAYLVLVLFGIIYLIKSFIPKSKPKCIYGECNGINARKDLKSGVVQFVIFKQGEQKSSYHPLGHLVDKWVNFDKSHWSNFTPHN